MIQTGSVQKRVGASTPQIKTQPKKDASYSSTAKISNDCYTARKKVRMALHLDLGCRFCMHLKTIRFGSTLVFEVGDYVGVSPN